MGKRPTLRRNEPQLVHPAQARRDLRPGNRPEPENGRNREIIGVHPCQIVSLSERNASIEAAGQIRVARR